MTTRPRNDDELRKWTEARQQPSTRVYESKFQMTTTRIDGPEFGEFAVGEVICEPPPVVFECEPDPYDAIREAARACSRAYIARQDAWIAKKYPWLDSQITPSAATK